jgi:hypothetical protein
MTGRELLAEMETAAGRIRQDHLERIRALGCPYASVAELGRHQHTIGAAKVSTLEDGSFTFSDDGDPAVIQPVVCDNRELGDAGIYDLIAWRTDCPSRWWQRNGNAFALGAELLDLPDPVPVVQSPLQWLAAAGKALCVLDWSEQSPAWPALRACPALYFTDDVLRERMRRAIVQSAPVPDMELFDHA